MFRFDMDASKGKYIHSFYGKKYEIAIVQTTKIKNNNNKKENNLFSYLSTELTVYIFHFPLVFSGPFSSFADPDRDKVLEVLSLVGLEDGESSSGLL